MGSGGLAMRNGVCAMGSGAYAMGSVGCGVGGNDSGVDDCTEGKATSEVEVGVLTIRGIGRTFGKRENEAHSELSKLRRSLLKLMLAAEMGKRVVSEFDFSFIFLKKESKCSADFRNMVNANNFLFSPVISMFSSRSNSTIHWLLP